MVFTEVEGWIHREFIAYGVACCFFLNQLSYFYRTVERKEKKEVLQGQKQMCVSMCSATCACVKQETAAAMNLSGKPILVRLRQRNME